MSTPHWRLTGDDGTLTRSKLSRGHVAQQAVEVWIDVRRDVSTARWKQMCIRFLYFCWLSTLIGIIVFLATWGAGGGDYVLTACSPSGAFTQFDDSFSWFSSNGFFQITLPFGTLDFTQAKVIDVVWDLFVGRGGQLIISIISWKVIASYLTASMTSRPETFTTFWVVFLQQETSFGSVYHLIRGLKRHTISSSIAKFFIIGTVIFVIAFPTLASALTGYTTANKAFVTDGDRNLQLFSDFSLVAYIIHDGKRIGLADDYMVSFRPGSSEEPLISRYTTRWTDFPQCSSSMDLELAQYKSCILPLSISDYVSQYGFYGLEDAESAWGGKKLQSPVLNISGFFFPDDDQGLFGHQWKDPRTQQYPFREKSNISYMKDNDDGVYSMKFIKDSGLYQPISETSDDDYNYQWGFSYMQSLVLLALIFIWSVGIGIMWLDACAKLPVRNELGKPVEAANGWRGIIQLANAISAELKAIDVDPDKLTNRELERKIAQLLKGGSIGFQGSISSSFKTQIAQWLKRERWWLAFLVLACSTGIVFMNLWSVINGGIFLIGMILATSFALAIGSSFGSRMVFLAFVILLIAAIGIFINVTIGS